MLAYSIYIHIPFCLHRCAYCDFNTYTGQDSLIPDYVYALQTEMQRVNDGAGKCLPVHTIYLGGGTPSLLPAISIAKILHALDGCFDLSSDVEISIEANRFNPEVVSYLEDMGYQIEKKSDYDFYFGAIHSVMKCLTREGFQGAAEVRRDGTAGGI